MFTRFNGNVVPFADDATSTNRTVFGGVTQSDAIDDNLNADFKKGWEIVGLNDNPTREDFNAMGYTLGALTAYLYEMGISEWNASQNYRVNSRVIGSDGNLYKSLTGTSGTPNTGNNPLNDVVNWKSLEAVFLTGNQTVAGIKTFTSSPIVPTPTANKQTANKDYVDTLITGLGTAASRNVGFGINDVIPANISSIELGRFESGDRVSYIDFHSSGAPNTVDFSSRIIREPGVNGALNIVNTGTGGIIFNSSPIVPTPTTNTQAANKAYVDSASSGAVPAGTIITVAKNTAPTGYLKANGALLSRTTYSALFEAIGTTFGAGDGSTTFALPDLRGYFPRGWDDGRGIDTSRVFGSNQGDGVLGNTVADYLSKNNWAYGIGSTVGGSLPTAFSSSAVETRPKNIALLYCIKY